MQTITSKDNPKIKEAAKLVQSKKARREKGLFLTEGLRLCMDAVKSGRIPLQTFLTQAVYSQLEQREDGRELLSQSREIYLITDEIADKLSDTQTPQGLFCTCLLYTSRCV